MPDLRCHWGSARRLRSDLQDLRGRGMSAGERLPWEKAVLIAETVSKRLRPYVARVKCVGSIRRHRPEVGDIEFLVEPHHDEDLLGGKLPILGHVRRELLEMGEWVKGADRMMQITNLLR